MIENILGTLGRARKFCIRYAGEVKKQIYNSEEEEESKERIVGQTYGGLCGGGYSRMAYEP